MKKIIGILVIVLLLGGVTFAVVGNKSKDSGMDMDAMNTSESANEPAVSTDAVATDKVTISNFKYSPATITVKKGMTVTWTNEDSVGHTVTADSMPGPDSQLFKDGQTYSYTYDKAGSYPYFCKPHTYMKATVIVTD